MTFVVTSSIIIILCVLVILWIIIRKTPLLAMIQLDTIPHERVVVAKKRILNERLERIFSAWRDQVYAIFAPLKEFVVNTFRALEQRLKAFEHALRPKGKPVSAQKIAEQLHAADELAAKSEYTLAEKKYIEVIAHDAKCISAYGGLGNVYLQTKELQGAQESFSHMLKLDHSDMRGYLGLGKVYDALNRPEDAWHIYDKALQCEPLNPKLLDCFIETSIILKRREAAESAIRKLQEANPDNEKVKEFWKRFQEMV